MSKVTIKPISEEQSLSILGLRNPRWVNWTINKKLGPEPWWWYVLRHLGIVGL